MQRLQGQLGSVEVCWPRLNSTLRFRKHTWAQKKLQTFFSSPGLLLTLSFSIAKHCPKVSINPNLIFTWSQCFFRWCVLIVAYSLPLNPFSCSSTYTSWILSLPWAEYRVGYICRTIYYSLYYISLLVVSTNILFQLTAAYTLSCASAQ